MNNRLHIFRSVEDEVFDYHSYPLNCAYEEIVNFEYDLKGLSGPGSWNGLTLKFWESNEFKVEKNDYKFEIGEQIYMSFSWAEITAGFSYAIKYCAIKDKKLGTEFAITDSGCVNQLIRRVISKKLKLYLEN